MNKEIIEAVNKEQFKKMMEAEKELKRCLSADTGGRPQATLGGLYTRIDGFLGTMTKCQDKIMLLQQLSEEEAESKSE
jgi:flagellin-specific chaperone FliS|tara:strand:+ start:375 stop:608 length:234 start_codon:yes stop_codon:yes gene_type:complete